MLIDDHRAIGHSLQVHLVFHAPSPAENATKGSLRVVHAFDLQFEPAAVGNVGVADEEIPVLLADVAPRRRCGKHDHWEQKGDASARSTAGKAGAECGQGIRVYHGHALPQCLAIAFSAASKAVEST